MSGAVVMTLNIALLFGSYRRDRLGVRAVRFAERELAARGHHVTTVDAQAVDAPMLDRTFGELGADAPSSLVRVASQLAAADVFLIVCGEYNHSLQPGLANLLDHFRQEYRWRPSALVSYSTGAFGGVRAAMHLREMVAELGMPAIPTSFPIPNLKAALDEDGHPSSPDAMRRFDRFVSEMEWYAEAFRARRQLGKPF